MTLMTAMNQLARFFSWRNVAVLALAAALVAGGARIALGDDSPSEDALRKEDYVAQDLDAADDPDDNDQDDDQDDDQDQSATRSRGDGDNTAGNDGTNGGNNTGDGDNTAGNDGTNGGNNTGDATNSNTGGTDD
jgi:hypothetical protein